MANITLIIIFCVLCVLAYLAYKPEKVFCAEAGKTADLSADEQKAGCYKAQPYMLQDENGNAIDTHNLQRVKVCGVCMEPVNICNGDEVWVEPVTQDRSSHDLIPGQVLLLQHPEKDVLKLRIFDSYDKNNKLITYRYENKEKHFSRIRHSASDVKGIVKYVASRG